jgi:hypothetical protein
MTPKAPHRRQFVGQLGGAAATLAAGALTAASAELPLKSVADKRVSEAMHLRIQMARADAANPAAKNVSSGDEARFADRGGSFTKGLAHDAFGRVTPAAFDSFKAALTSGKSADFENIVMGGVGTLNGPQAGLAFDLSAMDSVQFGQPVVPPAPSVASDVSDAELVEMYWASLLRDVAFTDYGSNATALAAAAELSGLPAYQGPRNGQGKVTADLLFRGGYAGETLGPYVSQLLLKPTFLGAQPLSQQTVSYLPGIDYMTSFADWLTVQNGNFTGMQNLSDPVLRHQRNGRDLAAYTHVDVLFQAYFVAFLALAGMGAPLNPGNPYTKSKTQNGFGTFGLPDFAGTLAEVATKALNTVWYQKWFVHLRPRPEAMGGPIHLIQTGQASKTDLKFGESLMKSQGLQQSYQRYGSWLLSQAFPEGSPIHPAYPTGHGTVGGACITLLKFFYDGDFVLPNPVTPATDGQSLNAYKGADAGLLTVNGELNKLGHNITFGHGILAGIHWRSDSDMALLLGEAVALSFLRNRAKTYNEPFTAQLTKFDGSIATISNEG